MENSKNSLRGVAMKLYNRPSGKKKMIPPLQKL
jgi:hypothetical protein